MQPFKTLTALAVPLRRDNVDTDAIIPKQYLKSILRTGYGPNLFDEWRYLESDPSKPNPEFVLNFPRYAGAQILVVGQNFGCGSSREHAPWALRDYGFRAIVGVSFADIFYNNSLKNGLLPAIVAAEGVAKLMDEIEANPGTRITVDLAAQRVTSPKGLSLPFQIAPDAKRLLLEGLDEIGLTLQHAARIDAYEQARQARLPWL
ncbi:MAG: 3-isopropylmalate dehydratase small subunit [Candidatus Lambdaproteobacteria bacterium]|nr:3-isopropylmalate dehydratase small subunit [Candidatus Lambdaproteobacteria bacterium]